jgi:hypothetical protein
MNPRLLLREVAGTGHPEALSAVMIEGDFPDGRKSQKGT